MIQRLVQFLPWVCHEKLKILILNFFGTALYVFVKLFLKWFSLDFLKFRLAFLGSLEMLRIFGSEY